MISGRNVPKSVVGILQPISRPIALLIFLVVLDLWTAWSMKLPIRPSDWPLIIAPLAVWVAVVELLSWLFTSPLHPRLRNIIRAGLRLILSLVAIMEHYFFARTGSKLDAQIVGHAFSNISDTNHILFSVANQDIIALAFSALLFFALGEKFGRGPRTAAEFWPKRAMQIQAGIAVLLGCSVILPSPPPPGNLLPQPPLASFISPLVKNQSKEPVITLGELKRSLYAPPSVEKPPARKPNIVLLILESTRADVLGPWARVPTSATPHLDRLAMSGLVADAAYTTVSHTSKALVGILCGFYPRLVTEITEALPDGLPLRCLPEILSDVGYRSAFMQTARGDYEGRTTLVSNMGFDEWRTEDDFRNRGYQRVGYLGLDDFAMLDDVSEWVASSDAPYFLTLLTLTTHHPYTPPGAPQALEPSIEDYRRAIAYGDSFLGALYESLDLEDQENTILIVVGDHGQAFGEHVQLHHNTVPYEEVTRIPLLIHAPRLVESGRVSGQWSQIDILPSLFDILDLRWTGKLPGKSLLSSERHGAVYSFCWYERVCGSMRKGQYKYVHRYGTGAHEVYDLAADPLEGRNIAAELPLETLADLQRDYLTFDASVRRYYEAHRIDSSEAPSKDAAPPVIRWH